MDIKDKLNRLDKSDYSRHLDMPGETVSGDWITEFQMELGGKIIQEKNSLIVLKENLYPLQSETLFEDIRDCDYIIPGFHRITGDPRAPDLHLRKTLFIDLETTGISGGAGTYAFLVGMGHVELDTIVVRQFLLPDFQYEWLLLKYINNSLLNFENIISFNGKTFDIPLLRNRFILNRMDSDLDELHHIDVLHAARRLWKKRLTSCDLVNLEYAVLGLERIHDVPGEMIPQIYFEFIRKRKAALLRDVLEHNYYDIANMMLLTMKIGLSVVDPLRFLEHDQDLFSLGWYYYRKNMFTEAVPLLENIYHNSEDALLKKEATFLLSMCHKKTGRHEVSSELFKKLLHSQKDHPEAIQELAKYYEHKEKNYPAALELVDRGIEYTSLLERLGKPTSLTGIKDDLMHRRHRLESKLRRQSEKNSFGEPD